MASMKSSMASLVSVSVGPIKKPFGHQQREVGGGGVLVVVEEAFGDVERGDVVVHRLFGEGEDEFVASAAIQTVVLTANASKA